MNRLVVSAMAAGDATSNTELEASVNTQISMLKDLLNLLNLEQEALNQRNYERLLEVSSAKQKQISEIEICHRHQPQLSEDSQALQSLISIRQDLSLRCSRLNLANGTQINKQAFVAQRSLDVIQGVDSSSYGMYSKQGNNIRTTESRMATVA